MFKFKKKDLNELVGGDISSSGGDMAQVNDTEIQTGPIDKTYDDKSDYEKGQPTTTDKVTHDYVQDIPWFAVYSFGGTRAGGGIKTFETTTIKKKNVEEKIDDLVKKSKYSDVTQKDYNPKVDKIIDTINDSDLSEKQLKDICDALENKKNQPKTTKKL